MNRIKDFVNIGRLLSLNYMGCCRIRGETYRARAWIRIWYVIAFNLKFRFWNVTFVNCFIFHCQWNYRIRKVSVYVSQYVSSVFYGWRPCFFYFYFTPIQFISVLFFVDQMIVICFWIHMPVTINNFLVAQSLQYTDLDPNY